MTAERPKSKGGKREGAGRKPIKGGRVTVLLNVDSSKPTRGLTISQAHWETIERAVEATGAKSNSEAFRKILEATEYWQPDAGD